MLIINKLLGEENVDHYEELENGDILVTILGEDVKARHVDGGLFVYPTKKIYTGDNFKAAFFKDFSVLLQEPGEIVVYEALSEDHALQLAEQDVSTTTSVGILRNKWMIYKDDKFLFEIHEDPNETIEVEGDIWILGEYLVTQIKSQADYDGIELNVLYIADSYRREVR